MTPIYLDHAATTPLNPIVLEAMLPYFTQAYGNPSSIHAFGREAKKALTRARDLIAQTLGCQPGQLVFTSGGTESDNMALLGASASSGKRRPHLITTQIEHQAVLSACRFLQTQHAAVTYIAPDKHGRIDPADIAAAIDEDTVLISVMLVNNEVGTIQPVREIGEIARSRGITFHVDAVQALGKLELNLSRLPIDLVSLSAHKINGPKGTGLLYAADPIHLTPRQFGGNQERKRRAGTENVPGIVGFSEALRIAEENREQNQARMAQYRKHFLDTLSAHLSSPQHIVINGHPTDSLPQILNLSLVGTDTETMLMNLDLAGVAASSGSACTSGSLELSHVLEAMRLDEAVKHAAVRFSFGPGNTLDEIETAAQKTATIANRLRNK